MYERRVRVIYPLEGGRIVLGTGDGWETQAGPDTRGGHEFGLTLKKISCVIFPRLADDTASNAPFLHGTHVARNSIATEAPHLTTAL